MKQKAFREGSRYAVLSRFPPLPGSCPWPNGLLTGMAPYPTPTRPPGKQGISDYVDNLHTRLVRPGFSSVPCYQNDGGRPIRIVKDSKITPVGGSSAPVCSTSHVETIPAIRPRIPSQLHCSSTACFGLEMVDGPKPRSTYSRPGRRSRADKELQFLPISARIEMQEVGREIGWL